MHRRDRQLALGGLTLLAVCTAALIWAAWPAHRWAWAVPALAGVWALAVAGTRAALRLAGQTITDPLTGLYNRRYLIDRLAEEVSRARRYGGSLTVAVLDIDDFKKHNDAFGHLAGDSALQALAMAIGNTLRRSDLAFRIGGEEFVLVMPDTGSGSARQALDRLAAVPLPVRFSAGLAECPGEAADPQTLVRMADARLLRAKASGKGRILDRDPASTAAVV